ncbi:MAG: Gfo/Idh/MocA family oxidoreductase [Ignavibacteriae bacterium]|nr:Gfo/Idh/MocA family oxidoreductase [Ignavibacteriota bacterium]
MRKFPMSRNINVALASFGVSGRVFHAPFIDAHPNLILAKIVERYCESSREMYPNADFVDDLQDVLLDETIDLVVVPTPDEHQFDIAERALLADKHVIIQSPFASSIREARQLIDLAIRRNRILTVYPNRRWDGDFLTIKNIVENGVLGDLHVYEAHLDRHVLNGKNGAVHGAKTQGKSTLIDLGSHLIDQAIELFGMPLSVQADLDAQEGNSGLGGIELILDYGRLNVILRARMAGPIARFIVRGTAASFIKFGYPHNESDMCVLSPLSESWAKEPKEYWGKLNMLDEGLHLKGSVETLAGSHMTYYESIYDAIALQYELGVKPEEALNTIRVIEAAIESNQQRRTILMHTTPQTVRSVPA